MSIATEAKAHGMNSEQPIELSSGLMSLRSVMRLFQVRSRTTAYRKIRAKEWPQPYKFGEGGRVRFRAVDVQEFVSRLTPKSY
jgi:predicted DNA-binding transcriptional regulator AlpA